MPDRTSEFFAAATSISSRANIASPIPFSHSLNANTHAPTAILLSKTEFAKAATQIGKELNATMLKLQKLATLAKNKSLFDDKPVEINELIFVIKQDIAKVHRQITTLNNYIVQNKGKSDIANKQTEEHSAQVLFSLQSKLATTSNEFQTVLETRNQNMKEQKTRRDEYSSSAVARIPQQQQSTTNSVSDSPLYFPNRQTSSSTPSIHQSRPVVHSENAPLLANADSTVIEFGQGNDTFGFQQQSLMDNNLNMEIIESRNQAIESIESTIAELGQIYQHFAQLLNSQREVVQRIDDNILDTEMNVSNAHDQLLKYYQNMSGNRWLMMKVFATVIFFTLIFVLFLH